MRTVKFSLLLLMLILLLTACGSREPEYVSRTTFQLDTVVSITLYDWTDTGTLDEVIAEIGRLESILSVDAEGSDLARMRDSAGIDWVDIQPETEELLQLAKHYHALSEGHFDVTAGPLISLWDIRNGQGHVPTQEELSQTLPLISDDKLLVEDGRAFLSESGMIANLGAIAKGYIADRAKDFLTERGVKHAVLDLGRNILLIGGQPDGSDFLVGVQDPNAAEGTVSLLLEASDMSMVTSGTDERYFEQDGQKYHHILDPFTGFPADNGLASVTILSAASADGDALSTACLLLGTDKGLALIESLPDIEALFIGTDGSCTMSSGFEAYLSPQTLLSE